MDDAYATLGLPRRFDLDLAELDRRYRVLARACHPDLRPPEQLEAALAESAALNAAYAALKDQRRRAEHLLTLAGAPDDPGPADPAFLAAMMELDEQLAEGDPAARAEAESLRAAAWADATAALRREPLAGSEARGALARVKYCDALLRKAGGA